MCSVVFFRDFRSLFLNLVSLNMEVKYISITPFSLTNTLFEYRRLLTVDIIGNNMLYILMVWILKGLRRKYKKIMYLLLCYTYHAFHYR